MLGTDKSEKKKWFTPRSVHQQGKTLNKSARFVITIKDSLKNSYDFTGPKNCFHLNQYLKKLKRTVSTSRNKIFLNTCLPLISIMASKNISFPLNRKSVATGRNKGFVENVFPRDGKTASNGKDIWDIGIKWLSLAKKISLH